jgi:hypothetical protein
MKNKIVGSVLISLCAVWMAGASAEEPRTINWEELAIKVSAADNPFLKLTEDQLLALSSVAGLRDRKSRGITLTPEETAIENDALAKLKMGNVDVDGLLAMRDAVAAKQQAAMHAVNPEVDGKMIRIPGYVLPLEFSGTKVSEFLLVPWVGACIHTPPPEPNQIVYVKPDKAFDIRRAFDAVWVTGRIAAKGSKRKVEIVDGSADVEVGYSLSASNVELY